MTSHPLPRKSRLELLRDGAYFADQLAKVAEDLEKIEGSGQQREHWTQAAAVARTVRSMCRHKADEERRRHKLKATRAKTPT